MESYTGLAIFYALFSVTVTLILKLKLTWGLYIVPYTLAFAVMLSKSGNKFFKELYNDKSETVVSYLSTNLINVFTLIGVFMMTLSYTLTKSKNVLVGTLFGVMLMVIVFPIAKTSLNLVITETDKLIKEKTDLDNEHKLPNIAVGLVVIGLLFGLQMLFQKTLDYSQLTGMIVKSNTLNNLIKNKYSLANVPKNAFKNKN